jgi:hypothetical protein
MECPFFKVIRFGTCREPLGRTILNFGHCDLLDICFLIFVIYLQILFLRPEDLLLNL